ncbi:hypothetical protein HDU97_005059 [Phlyctochytrium planicorne]|nr:hypothetical protein HDU97_005059 [Phlyctochytrium planicorne]
MATVAQQQQQQSLTSPANVTSISQSAKTLKQGWILKRAGSGFLSPWRLKYVTITFFPSSPPVAPAEGGGSNAASMGRVLLQISDQVGSTKPPKHEIWLDESTIGEDLAASSSAGMSAGVGGRKPVKPFVICSNQRKFHLSGQSKGESEEWTSTILPYTRLTPNTHHPLQQQPTSAFPKPLPRTTTSLDILRTTSNVPQNYATNSFTLPRNAGAAFNNYAAYQGDTTPKRRMGRSSTVRSMLGWVRRAESVIDDDAVSVISDITIEDDEDRLGGGGQGRSGRFGAGAGVAGDGGSVASCVETLSFCSEPVLTPHELTHMGSVNIIPVVLSNRDEPSRRRKAPLGSKERAPPVERWNEKYQQLLSQKPEDHEAKMRLDVQLLELIGAFEEAALQHAIQMIDDFHLKSGVSAHSLPPSSDPGSPTLVSIDGIIMHFVCDYENSTPEQIDAAMAKSAGELRSIDALNRTRCGLQTALMVLVDYKGFRIVAYADMGIDEKTRPIFDLSTKPPLTNDKATEYMMNAARTMWLKPHGVQVGEDRRVNVGIGANVEVHYDSNLNLCYAVNLYGVLPVDFMPPNAQTPVSSPHRPNSKGLTASTPTSPQKSTNTSQSLPQDLANLNPTPTRRLRPEFLKAYGAATNICISSDAFTTSSGCGRRERTENDAEAVRACKYLRDVWIPQFVAKFDALEIRPVDSRTLSNEMHAAGVNVRYLGYVAGLSSIPYIQELASIEMVARAAKSLFRAKLRTLILHFRSVGATQIEEETRGWAVNIFAAVLGDGERNTKYFEERLRPEILRKFNFDMDHVYFRCLHKPAIFLAMQYQCGVAFDDSTLYDFESQTFANPAVTRSKFLGFSPKRKHLNGIPLEAGPLNTMSAGTIKDVGSIISGHTGVASAIQAGLNEEGRQAYLLARHFKSQGPKGKLSRSDASALKLTEAAAHYNATGRFEEARRYGLAAINAAGRNTCISALAKAQVIEALGALSAAPSQPASAASNHGGSATGGAAASTIGTGFATSLSNLVSPSISASQDTGSGSSSGTSNAATLASSVEPPMDPALVSLYEGALQTVTWHCGPNSPMAMALHDRMANACLRSRRFVLALEYHNLSVTIALSALGKNHVVTAGYLTRMGVLLSHLKQTDSAIARLTEALNVLTSLATSDILVAEVHGHLAAALDARGDIDSAISHAQKCRKLREKALGQHDPRSVASFMQVSNLVLKPYNGYTGVLTPAIRAAYREAISCYEKVFRFVKASSNAAKKDIGNGQWSSAASVISASTHITTLSGSVMENGSTTSASVNATPYRAPPVAGPGLEPPYGGPPPPIHLSILHKLTKQIVALKLTLLDSPRHKEVVRNLRAAAAAGKEYDSASMRDVVLRMAAVSPSIYLDGVMARIDDEDASAVDELAIALFLTERETLGV